MEDLRLAIIVLGVFSILGILVHGLWTIRKNAVEKNKQKARKEPGLTQVELSDDPLLSDDKELSPPSSLQDEWMAQSANFDDAREPSFAHSVQTSEPSFEAGFDEDGIGQVRTVARSQVEPMAFSARRDDKPRIEADEEEDPIPDPPSSLLKSSEGSKTAATLTQPNPPQVKPASEPPHTSLAKSEPIKPSFAEKAKQFVSGDKKERSGERRVEPKLASDDQIRMDFDTHSSVKMSPSEVDSAPKEAIQEEVLVLNVKMPEGKNISGAALLPALLTLGFKFGEQNVFHRHAASNGKGPKLFSLANMFKPGTFDVDAMETFETQGLSLFMILPIEGEPQQVFNMMHNAARKLADEFGAQILDARRSLLTKQSLQQYVEKIREFERRRMINRS